MGGGAGGADGGDALMGGGAGGAHASVDDAEGEKEGGDAAAGDAAVSALRRLGGVAISASASRLSCSRCWAMRARDSSRSWIASSRSLWAAAFATADSQTPTSASCASQCRSASRSVIPK